MDDVQSQGDDLIIISKNHYPWEIRSYRKWCFVIEGKKYWIAAKQKDRSSYLYILKPWLEHDTDIPGDVIHYDPDYVDHFRSTMRKFHAKRSTGLMLSPLLPLIGFLWSDSKAKLEEKFGLDSYHATEWALRIQMIFIMFCGVFLLIDLFTGESISRSIGISKKEIIPACCVVILDSIYKYDGIQREERPLFGFYEWLYWIIFKAKD